MAKNKRLFLCEKPSTARLLSDVLGKGSNAKGAIIAGNGDILTYAFGHLLEPVPPEAYNEENKKWSWETLPILPATFQLKPRDAKASEQLGTIRKLLMEASEVVMATDADREGELIGYEVLRWCKWKGPTTRLWLSDLTPPAIKKALANLKPIEETTPYALAAEARQQADWLVGMNITRAATLKMRETPNGSLVSIGRVQTPTLALIVRREREILAFKPEPYFDVKAKLRSAKGHEIEMRVDPEVPKPKTREEADALMRRLEGGDGAFSVGVEDKVKKPPKLLDLDTLQQQCNRLFGMTSDATLKAAQALYEEHRLLTYPRTDCRYLPEEQKPLAKDILANVLPLFKGKDLGGLTPETARITSNTYNDRQITAHHAIVPTSAAPDLSNLSDTERQVYMLVARYFVAAHMPDHEYQATTIEIEIDGVPLVARGKKTKITGWRGVFEDVSDNDKGEDKGEGEDDAEAEVPPILDGEGGRVVETSAEAKETQPPSRYTEATLLKAMKNVASLVEDEALKKVLKNAAGIGTPATRANIIETLKKRQFMTVKKKSLVPTELGMNVIAIVERVVPHYADPTVTANWETKLEGIVSRGGKPESFITEIKERVSSDIGTLRSGTVADLVTAAAPRTAGKGAGAKGASGKGGFGKGSSGKGPGPAGGAKSFAPPKDAVYLTVAYDQRDKVKSLGARWDGEKKKWYIPATTDPAPFKQAGFLS